jgi:peptidoglycan/LPS O-acetylase OafA/YrhL
VPVRHPELEAACPPEQLPPKARVQALDALRGASALAVVVHHLPFIFHHPDWLVGDGFTRFGVFGVQMFFVLSGFVIFMSLQRAKSVAHFLLERVIRIYPLYAASVVVTTIAVYFTSDAGAGWLAIGATNLLFVHRLLGLAVHVDGVYWTLQIEAAFYLWLGALWGLGRTPERTTRLLLFAVCVHTLGAAVSNILGLTIPRAVRMGLLLDYGFLFWSGALFHALRSGSAPRRNTLTVLTLVLATLPFTAVPRDYTPFVDQPQIYWLACALVIASFAAVTFVPWFAQVIARPGLVFIGRCSYAVYLGHFQLGHTLFGQLVRHVPVPVAALLTLLCIGLFAVGLTVWWDEPVRRRLRRRLNDASKASAAPNMARPER